MANDQTETTIESTTEDQKNEYENAKMRAELLVNQLEKIKTDNVALKKNKGDINVELDV